MLRGNLYKKFSKSNLPKAVEGVEQPAVNTPYPLDEIKRSSAVPTTTFKLPELKPIGPIRMSQGWTPEEIAAYKKKNGTPMPMDPLQRSGMPDLLASQIDDDYFNQDQVLSSGEQLTNIPLSIQNAANLSNQTAARDPQKKQTKINPSNMDYNAMLNVGLGLTNMGLGFNEDITNQRILNESIQNRQSKPLYDYNYMYGRTTSGGTEYQPTIKAEMGAQITKRLNTPYGANNVEIEGGEFIQLPDFNTEYAEGPSHAQGGIKTNLPEGTRVYSDHLKPEGSKKTFAQLAKKYDISGYKTTIDDPFKKQVDKDTATIMLKRNQAKLDELFNNQQSMNGDSNGEMRDGGINNPGFRALPKAVQDQILANMEYGGYQLPEYAIGGTIDQLASQMINQSRPGASLFNQKPSQQVLGNQLKPTNSAKTQVNTNAQQALKNPDKSTLPPDLQPYANWDSGRKTWRVELPDNLESEQLGKIASAAEQFGIKNLVQSSNQRLTTGSKDYEGFYGGMKPQDYEKRIVEEKLGKAALKGLDEVAVRKKAFELLEIDPTKYNVNDAKKLYNDKNFRSNVLYPAFTKYLPEANFRKDQGNDFKLGLEHYDAIKTPKDVNKDEIPVVDKTTPKGNEYDGNIAANAKGKYTRSPYDIIQSIPNVYGLAEAQTIFPYAIPEINAPYLKPQTLNIQSELQDLDNMGTAAVRAGADPLATYIASTDAKQKAFQTKQNYDANARSQADQFNAQGQLSADQMNANSFNRVYNDLIGSARANQSAIKQDQLSALTKKYADWNSLESEKEFYYNNLIPSFNLDASTTNEMEVANAQKFTRTKQTPATKEAKKGMLVSSKKSLTKFKK